MQAKPRTAHLVPGRVVLAVCCIAQFMVVLDISIVTVALPQIRLGLGMSAAGEQWIVNAYTLVFGGFLLFGGRAADLFGRRRVFMIGLSLFTVSSLAGGLAQDGGWLIAARAVQGLGAAVLAPATLSVLTTTFTEPAERRRALGAWAATAASGVAAGVLAGGVLTGLAGWRWVLFVNVPIGAALIGGAAVALAESTADLGHRHLDLPGAVTVTAGLTALVYGIISAENRSWGSPATVGAIAAAFALLVAFVLIEAQLAPHPLVPLHVFRHRTLTMANVIGPAARPWRILWQVRDWRLCEHTTCGSTSTARSCSPSSRSSSGQPPRVRPGSRRWSSGGRSPNRCRPTARRTPSSRRSATPASGWSC